MARRATAWLLATLLSSGLARAQAAAVEPVTAPAASPDARERARAEFRAGVALARSALHAKSCEAFERSWQLLPHAATLYNLAESELALGQLAAARHHLRSALARDAAREELTPVSRASAAERVAALDSELVELAVSLPVDGAEVSVDGHPVWVDEEGGVVRLASRSRVSGRTPVRGRTWSLLVEPGRHALELWHVERHLVLELNEAPGARVTWDAERFSALAPPALVAPPPVAAPSVPRLPLRPPPRTTTSRSSALPELETAAWVLAGVGVTSTVLFGALVIHERSELADACPEPARCPVGTNVAGRRDSIQRFALLADISLVAALVGLGAGVTLRVTGPH